MDRDTIHNIFKHACELIASTGRVSNYCQHQYHSCSSNSSRFKRGMCAKFAPGAVSKLLISSALLVEHMYRPIGETGISR